jgi:hypothetical protein
MTHLLGADPRESTLILLPPTERVKPLSRTEQHVAERDDDALLEAPLSISSAPILA